MTGDPAAGTPGTAREHRLYDAVMHVVLRSTTLGHRALHAATGGRLGRRFPGGATVVWLTLPGRRSGVPRTTPLLAAREHDAADAPWVVAGSNAGQSAMPAWVHNARAADEARLEVDGARCTVRVQEIVDPHERAAAYARLVTVWRFYAGYARRTARRREIPLFRLTPLDGPAGAQRRPGGG